MAEVDISTLLDDGLQHFARGQPAKALELWYRVLDLEPRHPKALEYVQYVRDNLHVDVREPGFGAADKVHDITVPDWGAEMEPAAPFVEVAAPVVEAAAPVVEAAAPVVEVAAPVIEPAAPVVEAAAPVVEAAAPVGRPPSAAASAFSGGWGDLALGDLDLDPRTGEAVQRAPASDDVRQRRVKLEQSAPFAIAAPPPVAVPVAAAAPAPVLPAPVPTPPVLSAVPVPPAVDVEEAPELPSDAMMPAPAPAPLVEPPSAVAAAAEPPKTELAASLLIVSPSEDAVAESPWDGHSGITEAVNLDGAPGEPTAMDLLLAGAVRRPLADGKLSAPDANASAQESSASEKPAGEPQSEVASLMEGARDLFELGDFSGSLELVEKVLRQEPDNAEARAYLTKNESTLLKMYESKLGDVQNSPRVLTSPDEVIWMNLHHRAGFVLSQVDGELTYDDIAVISGMSRFEAFKILAELIQNGVIG